MRRLILICMCCLLLCGCLSKGDPSEDAFVLAFGIERGATYPYRFALMIAMPKGGEENAAMDTKVIAVEARTLHEAIEAQSAALPLHLNFSRTALILISESLLQDGKLQELSDLSLGAIDIHSNVRIMAANGSMQKLLEGMISEADPAFTKTMRNIDVLDKYFGTVIDARCRAVWETLGDPAFDLILPYIGTGELEPDSVGEEAYPKVGAAETSETTPAIIGTAVFDGGRMVGTLSGFHTMLCGMVRGDFAEGTITLYHPKHGTMSFRLTATKLPGIAWNGNDAAVALHFDCEVLSPISSEKDTLAPWLETELQTALDRVYAVLRELHADAMGLNRAERLRHPFDLHPADASEMRNVSFSVSVRIRREGGAS